MDTLEQVAHTWLGGDGFKYLVDGFQSSLRDRGSSYLDHIQVHLATCALLAERHGHPWWVTKVRVFDWGANEESNSNQHGHEVLRSDLIPAMFQSTPTMGFAILRSLNHTMAAIHTRTEYFAVDGLDHERQEFKPLARSAMQQFEMLGFPKRPTTFDKPWQQKDNTSCGYHVLHFLHHVLFRCEGCEASDFTGGYHPPEQAELGKEWANFAGVLDRIIAKNFGVAFQVAIGVNTRMI